MKAGRHLPRRLVLTGLGAIAFAGGWWLAAADATPATAVRSPLGSEAACGSFSGLPEGFGRDRTAGMVYVPGGRFTPGSDAGYPEERATGLVSVERFWMDRTEVTNAQFAAFVEATGYVTDAERKGGGAVFMAPRSAAQIESDGDWWHYVRGANWKQPEGPGSDLKGRAHEPVILVTEADALAYAHWLGRDLPTEAEWEFAAQGHSRPERLERAPRDEAGSPAANFWQGIFPLVNTHEDGYAGRSPVGCYAANGYGLHDMIGNAWEWTRDGYRDRFQPHGNGDPWRRAGEADSTLQAGGLMVIKGGSYLCSSDYCARFRTSARYPQDASLPTSHVGFRTVLRDG